MTGEVAASACVAFSRSDDGWPHRQPADARVSGAPRPALNDHQARGHTMSAISAARIMTSTRATATSGASPLARPNEP